MVTADTVNVEVPVPPEGMLTLIGLNEIDGPLGETEAIKFTVLENPARLVRLMVEVAEDPGVTASPLGLGEMKKSGCEGCETFTEIMTECGSVPS